LNGRQAEAALRAANLTCNRNVIPSDPNGAWYTSGLRLGSPAMTTLGMGREEMQEIARILHEVLSATRPGSTASGEVSQVKFISEPAVVARAQARAADLLARHPLYPGLELD
jgi:glycine hydroxymethyltransferase